MGQIIINTGNIANDGTGAPLRTAFTDTNYNFTQLFAAGPVGSNITIANNTIQVTNNNGNLQLATNGIGVVVPAANFVPDVPNVRSIGLGTNRFSTVYAQYINAATGTFSGNVYVAGNLQVTGNVITVNYSNLSVANSNVTLATGAANAAQANGGGLLIPIAGANFTYNYSANSWNSTIAITAPTFIGDGANLTNVIANVQANALLGNTFSNSINYSNLTSFGQISALSITGNVSTTGNVYANAIVGNRVTANYLYGNGSNITNITANAIVGNVPFALVANTAYVANLAALATQAINADTALFAINANLASFANTATIAQTANAATYAVQADNANSAVVAGMAYQLASTANLSIVGNITTSGYFIGDGGLISNIVVTTSYGNSNVAVYLPTDNTIISIQSNVSNNSSNITTLQGQVYANGNVSSYLQALTSNISTTGNITASYFFGNGSQLTGIASNYGNANTAGFLANFGSNTISTTGSINAGDVTLNNLYSPNYYANAVAFANSTGYITTSNLFKYNSGTEVLTVGTVSATGNITANYFVGNGSQLTNLPASYSNADVSTYLANSNVVISTTGNITGSYILGNGSQLTGLPSGSGNTGNVTFDNNIVVGTGDEIGGSGLYLAPGANSSGNLQYLRVRGGDVATHIHLDTGDNGYFDQYFGDDSKYVKLESGGNISIGTNTYNWAFDTDGNLTLPGNSEISINYANGDPYGGYPSGNSGAVQINWLGDFSNQGGTPGDTYTTMQFDGDGLLDINGNTAYQPRVDYTPYITVNTPRVESTDFGIVAGPGITVVGYDDNYNTPRSAYMSVQDQATATQQWDFGILGNGSNNYSITDRTAGNAWTFGTDGNLTVPGNISAVGNITGSYILGNGSQLTGISASYGNANVVANLAALGSNPISTTGNITAGNISTGVITLTNGATIQDTVGDAVAFGSGAGLTNQGLVAVAIGNSAGNVNQGNISVAIGYQAGNTSQGDQSVAIGDSAGKTTQGESSVAVGQGAGQTTQGGSAIAIGFGAGATTQGTSAIAFGRLAGQTTQGIYGVAIGFEAGQTTQGNSAVAIGENAGYNTQGISAVAVGDGAGRDTQGQYAVAIGYGAGNSNQANNSIILNATGSVLEQTTVNTFTVKPVRQANTANAMYYDASTGEITYDTAGGGGNTGNVTFDDQAVVGTGDQVGSSGLYLAPGTESVGNLQYIRVRGGDVATHIHLDTGNNAYFDQYFGSDIKYVKLEAAGNVVIGSDDATGNSAQWNFDTTGNLTFPTGNLVITPDDPAGNIASIASTDHPLSILSTGANGAAVSIWIEDYANVGISNIAAVYANPTPGSGIVRIAVGQNGSPGPNLWDFNASGALTLPQGSQISETSNTSVNITANANTWAFGVNGNLTLPNSATIIAPNVNDLTLRVTGQYNICTLLTGGSGYGGGGSSSAISGGTGTGMIVGYGYGLSGQVVNVGVTDPGTGYSEGDVLTMTAGNGGATFVITKYNTAANAGNNNTAPTDWTFGVDGNITLPNNYSSINYANGSPYGGGGGNTGNVTFNDINVIGTGNLHLQPDPTNAASYLDIFLTSGPDLHVTNNDGSLILGEDAGANVMVGVSPIGNVSIQSWNGYTSTGNTWIFDSLGNLTLPANTFAVNYANGDPVTFSGGGGNTGNVTFDDVNIIGTGNLNLQPNGASNEYLNIYLTGNADIHVAAGGGVGNVILGTDEQANVAVLQDGNVAIQAGNVSGTKTWNFDTTGNLTLPLNSVVYETNIPDGGLSGSAIALKPTGGTNADQQLLIYPTTNDANHLHLTSGNLYSTELFFGSDDLYVKLANTGNVVINTNDNVGNSAQWTFGVNGGLRFPDNSSISGGEGVFGITSDFSVGIFTNAGPNINQWLFGNTGNLTLPANTFAVNYANGTPVSIGGSDYGNANVANFLGDFGSNVISTSGNITASGLLIDTVTGITSNAGNININQITGLGGYLNAFGANFSGDINAANLSLSGNIISNANISGNVNAANISAGNISLSGNIFAYGANIYSVNGLTMEGGNLTMSSNTGMGGSISAEGNIIGANVNGQNINGGNLSLSGNVLSNLNIQQGNISVSGNITSGSELTVVSANITGVQGLTVSGGDITIPSSMSGGSLSAYGNITGNYILGNGSQLTSLPAPAVTQDITSNGYMSIMLYDGNIKYNNYATVEPSSGNISGANISAAGNVTANTFVGNGSGLTNVAQQTTGSWSVTAGTNTYSFTVSSGTYNMWVTGNIPNGIIAWNALATITNTNVPVVGTQYAWVYNGGGTPLDFVSIPNQFIGTANAIVRSNVAPSSTTNRFDFSINNTSGNSVVVNYGYTKLY